MRPWTTMPTMRGTQGGLATWWCVCFDAHMPAFVPKHLPMIPLCRCGRTGCGGGIGGGGIGGGRAAWGGRPGVSGRTVVRHDLCWVEPCAGAPRPVIPPAARLPVAPLHEPPQAGSWPYQYFILSFLIKLDISGTSLSQQLKENSSFVR